MIFQYVQEIRNAFATYEKLETWDPASGDYLCRAHKMLMHGLVDAPGKFRTGSTGKGVGKISELSGAETTQQMILHGNKYDNRQ